MSYCRWSSDNWTSDVYTYEHVDGFWATHVAGRRHVGHITPLPPIKDGVAAWVEASAQQSRDLEKCELVEIGLPYDGQTFEDAGPAEAAATLKMLREAGYHIPDGVIEELEGEAQTPEKRLGE